MKHLPTLQSSGKNQKTLMRRLTAALTVKRRTYRGKARSRETVNRKQRRIEWFLTGGRIIKPMKIKFILETKIYLKEYFCIVIVQISITLDTGHPVCLQALQSSPLTPPPAGPEPCRE